ncbi:hypothetical protein DSECCO2_99800 [anaerobic digester metagenome]
MIRKRMFIVSNMCPNLSQDIKIVEFLKTPPNRWEEYYSKDEIRRLKNRMKSRAKRNLNELAYIAISADRKMSEEIFDIRLITTILFCVSSRLSKNVVEMRNKNPTKQLYYLYLLDSIIDGLNASFGESESYDYTITTGSPDKSNRFKRNPPEKDPESLFSSLNWSLIENDKDHIEKIRKMNFWENRE